MTKAYMVISTDEQTILSRPNSSAVFSSYNDAKAFADEATAEYKANKYFANDRAYVINVDASDPYASIGTC